MFHSLIMLATDANRVVGLRVMKLMLGGRGARLEAQLMVSEKIDAAVEASASLMAGASGDEIVRRVERCPDPSEGEQWTLFVEGEPHHVFPGNRDFFLNKPPGARRADMP